MSNAHRLLAGLLTRGYRPTYFGADGVSIGRNLGQARMNIAAGEAAPTWFLADDRGITLKMSRADGAPMARHGSPIQFCSHVPLKWLLKFPPSEWEIDDENFLDAYQIRIDPPRLPPNW